VKSWNLIEVVNELCPAAGELGDHARSVSLAVSQRVDGGALGKLRHAGIAIDRQQGECRGYFRGATV